MRIAVVAVLFLLVAASAAAARPRGTAHFGPRRFYVINTGVSTVKSLAPAAEILARDGILLRFTDLIALSAPIEKTVAQQEGGTHADEIETSMMLYIAPGSVRMDR